MGILESLALDAVCRELLGVNPSAGIRGDDAIPGGLTVGIHQAHPVAITSQPDSDDILGVHSAVLDDLAYQLHIGLPDELRVAFSHSRLRENQRSLAGSNRNLASLQVK